MKNPLFVMTLLFATCAAQFAMAENHIAPDEPILVPEDDPVVIPVLEPVPNVSITINTGSAGDQTENWDDYNRGFDDGYGAGYNDGYFEVAGEFPPAPVDVANNEGDDASQVTVETTTDPDTPDTVNVEINVADDTANVAGSEGMDEPVFVMDPNAAGDGAAGISPEFRAALNAHTLAVLDWQLKTSERVLLLIMFMSTAGILFAGYQLWRSFDGLASRAPLAEGATPAPQPAQANSTVSFDKGKFEVSSPVVGILVLVISLAALYMFLNFVYQIDVVPVGAAAEVTEAFE